MRSENKGADQLCSFCEGSYTGLGLQAQMIALDLKFWI